MRLKTSSCLRIPWDFSTKLGLRRHSVSWTKQLLGFWPFWQETDIVGLPRPQPVHHSNKSTLINLMCVYICIYTHSIGYVPLEHPDCYRPSCDNCIQKPNLCQHLWSSRKCCLRVPRLGTPGADLPWSALVHQGWADEDQGALGSLGSSDGTSLLFPVSRSKVVPQLKGLSAADFL